jgi:hypothetical protein
MAISILYNPYPMRLFEADGDFAAGAQAFFWLARTTTPLLVYTDSPLTTAHTWPVVADAYGLLAPIYIAKGTEYKVRIEDALGSVLYAADGIDNPAAVITDVDSEGGTITTEQVFRTGDMIWNAATGTRVGWVRCNGRTISSATGLGTERQNNDCEALFAYFWDNFDNTICPVSGGRGANAAADWAPPFSKSIATLDMRGRSIAGRDDMGTTAANVIQVQPTLTTTSASPTATVSNGTGICRGMYIIAAGVPASTYVTSIDNTTITMSANATATASGVAARFSVFFPNATTGGASGGQSYHIQSLEELARHYHLPIGVPGVAWINPAATNLSTGGSTGVSGNTSLDYMGSNSAMNNWTPTRLGTFYAKL